METIFLSYTYKPHPDHEERLDYLRRALIRVIESMELRVIDGVDVGGRPLDAALQERIEKSDALLAILTPQQSADGSIDDPKFVISEFQHANALKIPTLRVIHDALIPRGLAAGNEYVPYKPDNEIDVVLKLMRTIAVWKREYGRVVSVRIEPDNLASQYDEDQADKCEYQLIRADGTFEAFQRARVRLDPGAFYAELPKLLETDRVRLRMKLKGKAWRSKHAINPFVGGVRLEEQP